MRTEIIAEIGINHCGDMGVARYMIKRAAEAGADCVKFQLYDPNILLDQGDFTPGDWEQICRAELAFEDLKMLKLTADRKGVGFLASAFDAQRLGWLEDLGVKRHKIASRTVYDKEYCDLVMGTGKPYLVSSGMLNDAMDEPMHMKILTGFAMDDRCSLLYCVSDYPTKLKDVKFNRQFFKTDLYNGFSDHTEGISCAIFAISCGAQIIEKHFTMDKEWPGPDQRGSAEPDELKALCRYRDDLELIREG